MLLRGAGAPFMAPVPRMNRMDRLLCATFMSSAMAAMTPTPSTRAAATPLQSALLVTRAPVLQASPSKFEQEYYRFNVALSNKLQQPFPRDMYFKKGSAAESRFDAYYAQLQSTWDITTESKTRAELENKSMSTGSESDAELYATLPRTTEADAQNDQQSLERALDQTLYLVVKMPAGDKSEGPTWRLPTKALPTSRSASDSLHDTATEAVEDALGSEMDIWLVSKLPIAVIPASQRAKTYILKAHILAGEPVPANGVEYAWLTRDELAQRWSDDPNAQKYWAVVQDLLDA
ncbi:hypothetical protein Malapachy_3584 [Malassezia pachydermatis]|uniref:Large ribosomal subunit protein mL46 n=1 Tax=Malassezia pachydermatis TaxID=77020 RepID=A0A0M8MP80_9BASI|nr:hypothetical protein Malapachy_3584 [Malassezia pachydermatis]KOS16466.1 hypothetical protein Malapachy_3584 [Malassezia pachydermatis]